MSPNATRKSLEPEVFQVGATTEKDALIGSKCPNCLRVYFPARKWCAACAKPDCKEFHLSREGILSSYAVVYRKQQYAVVPLPYILGEVALPEGVLVYTTINLVSVPSAEGLEFSNSINAEDPESLKLGENVVLDPVVVKKDEQGNDVIAFNFKTVKR